MWGTNNTIFRDCKNINATITDVYYLSSSISKNNTFINCSFDSESVEGDENELIRKWYFTANISNSTSQLENANVTVYNNSGDIVFTELKIHLDRQLDSSS